MLSPKETFINIFQEVMNNKDEIKNKYPIFQLPPIMCFGDIENAEIITVALNASDREFKETSLKNEDFDPRSQWESQRNYFRGKIYERWWKRSRLLLSPSEIEYIISNDNLLAAHIDLIPLASHKLDHHLNKELMVEEKEELLDFLRKYVELSLELIHSTSTKIVIFYGLSEHRGSYVMKRLNTKFITIEWEKSEEYDTTEISYGFLKINEKTSKTIGISKGPSSRLNDNQLRKLGLHLRQFISKYNLL